MRRVHSVSAFPFPSAGGGSAAAAGSSIDDQRELALSNALAIAYGVFGMSGGDSSVGGLSGAARRAALLRPRQLGGGSAMFVATDADDEEDEEDEDDDIDEDDIDDDDEEDEES